MGMPGIGRHVLSTRKITTAPAMPHTPPASETRIASANSWRRMYWRFDPRAMRRAISRERSAARAANTLPRLAHAASRIRPASSVMPNIKARAGRPSVSPTSPGRARENLSSSSSFGFDLAIEAAMVFRSDAAAAGVTPGFKWPAIQVKWVPRSSNGSHGGRIAVEVIAPVGIAEDDVGHAVLTMLVGCMDKPAKIGLHAQGVKVIAAYQVRPHDRGTLAAGIESNCPRNVIRHQGFEAVVAVAQVAVIRIGLRRTVPLAESALQHEQVFRVRNIQRAQHQRIQYAKNNGIGANGQGEGEHRC